jgi:hypothetical protein
VGRAERGESDRPKRRPGKGGDRPKPRPGPARPAWRPAQAQARQGWRPAQGPARMAPAADDPAHVRTVRTGFGLRAAKGRTTARIRPILAALTSSRPARRDLAVGIRPETSRLTPKGPTVWIPVRTTRTSTRSAGRRVRRWSETATPRPAGSRSCRYSRHVNKVGLPLIKKAAASIEDSSKRSPRGVSWPISLNPSAESRPMEPNCTLSRPLHPIPVHTTWKFARSGHRPERRRDSAGYGNFALGHASIRAPRDPRRLRGDWSEPQTGFGGGFLFAPGEHARDPVRAS